MPEQEIIDFIKQEREQRVSDVTIIDALSKAGWQRAEINDAFKLLNLTTSTEIPVESLPGQAKASDLPPPSMAPVIGKKIILGSVVGVVLCILSYFILVLLPKGSKSNIPVITKTQNVTKTVTKPPKHTSATTLSPTGQTIVRNAKRQSDLITLQNNLKQFFADRSEYPYSLNLLIPNYLTTIPSDPKTFIPYDYKVAANRANYSLCAVLDDGKKYCVDADTEPQIGK